MEKETRNAIERATQKARRLLEHDFSEQMTGIFGIMQDGRIDDLENGKLDNRQQLQREVMLAAISHKRAYGMQSAQATADYLRDAAFTTINRFVALKMLERRGLVQECINRGDASSGFSEFTSFAPGLRLPDGSGYRLYIESIFNELATEIKVLFDLRDPAAVLWPRKLAFEILLGALNAPDLQSAWDEDETIGWVYQYFNSSDERRTMREASPIPSNSRDLAVRNQFFTPDYIVKFLVENTLGILWNEQRNGDTKLALACSYMVGEVINGSSHRWNLEASSLAQEERQIDDNYPRQRVQSARDPRSIKAIDPACGSGHFLLSAFDIFLIIYQEAWSDPNSLPFEETGNALNVDYPNEGDFRRAVPGLILRYNLYGVDIDPRCGQIAQLALWLRAQKAFSDAEITRAQRPMIVRSNIVIAEPMPGEQDLLDTFLLDLTTNRIDQYISKCLHGSNTTASHASNAMADSLRSLVRAVWDALKLAGEMGLLLRIEQLLVDAIQRGRAEWEARLPLFQHSEFRMATSQSDDGAVSPGTVSFWDNAEAIVFEVLGDYASSAGAKQSMRHRLFAEDTMQGFALTDIATERFDVVLMNPPFGEPTEQSSDNLPTSSCNNLYSAFVMRAIELCTFRIGAITDRTFMTQASFAEMRRAILGESASISAFVDLGWGVLDANVQTAAYVLSCVPGPGIATFLDLRDELDKATALISRNFERNIDIRAFLRMPDMIIAPNLPGDVINAFVSFPALNSQSRLPRGLGSNDAKRTFRSWYEVKQPHSNANSRWKPLANGGECSPFWRENSGVVLWETLDGRLWTDALRSDRSKIYDQSGVSDYFHLGLNFPKQSSTFNVAFSPMGQVPTREGKAIIFVDNSDCAWVAAYLNSGICRSLIRDTTGLHKQSGSIGRVPIASFTTEEKNVLAEAALSIAGAVRASYQCDETSLNFVLPACLMTSLTSKEEACRKWDKIDALIHSKFPSTDPSWISPRPSLAFYEPSDLDLLSWCVGVVFGRFDMRLATGERTLPPRPNALDVVPTQSAGMIPLAEEPPLGIGPAILVSDTGHPDDLTALIGNVIQKLGLEQSGDFAPAAVKSCIDTDFATHHVLSYSKSRRKAPIYWQFGTATGAYSVWLYIHRFTADTLHRVRGDYIAPKLTLERRKLASIRTETGATPSRLLRKQIEAQESLVDEIIAFDEEIARVTSLWHPDLDDGVAINIAPFWRLMPQNSSWRKEIKTTWDGLCEGKYDWSQLAMRLWPERVVPKCATDRSLAISHGLEDVFWFENPWGEMGISQATSDVDANPHRGSLVRCRERGTSRTAQSSRFLGA